MTEEYTEGALKGQASVDALIDAQTLTWLKHASKETGYTVQRLVEISASESALNYAKENGLI